MCVSVCLTVCPSRDTGDWTQVNALPLWFIPSSWTDSNLTFSPHLLDKTPYVTYRRRAHEAQEL